MNDDIELMDNDVISLHQEKYSGNFQSSLDISQELVDQISLKLREYGLYTCSYCDKNAFVDKNGKILRLWDIEATSLSGSRIFCFEAKDFAKCVCYEITGLPQAYIDGKMMKANGGKDLYLIFRDNMKWVEEVSQRKKNPIPMDATIRRLIHEGLAKMVDGEVKFLPYGNNLEFLMRPENQRKDKEDVIRCKFKAKYQMSRYNGEIQYLWKTSAMKPLDKLIEGIVDSSSQCSRESNFINDTLFSV